MQYRCLWNKFLGLCWTLIETVPMTEGHKIILKPEIPTISWEMTKKRFYKEGGTQKSFIIK